MNFQYNGQKGTLSQGNLKLFVGGPGHRNGGGGGGDRTFEVGYTELGLATLHPYILK